MDQPNSTEVESTDSIVEAAKKRFKRAQAFYDSARVLAVEDTKFAMGDSDNGWQWPDDIRNVRKLDKRVCLTVNMTAQHCNQIINQIRMNRPSIKVSPVDSGADKKTAELLGGLIRNIQVASSADDAHDCAAEHAIYGGEGYWRIVTDYETPDSFNQVINIKPITNPSMVYIDPDAKELDKSDAAWGFVFEDIPKEQFRQEYPGIDPESWSEETLKTGWADDSTVRIADYYYVEWKDDTACLLGDGTTCLKSKLPPGAVVVKERKTKVKHWTWCKLVGGHDDPVEETEWLGDYLPIIAVVGKELNVNGQVVRKGIVRDLKDPARMVNYAYSETVQTLALQNKVPYMAASEAISGYENVWKAANLENRAYLPYNAFDEEGKPIPPPARQPPAVMPAAQVDLLHLSTEQMRAASGQQNANFGIKSEAASGVGIQRLKVQGEVATFHFPDNLARALKHEARVLIDLIQKYYDTPRVVRILGLDGSESQAMLHPKAAGYNEAKSQIDEEVQQIFNPTVGRYDVTIDTGPAYQTQRQEAFAALSEIAAKNPQLMQVAGDLVFRAADFPMADELADRLAKTLPPQLQDKKGQPEIPPEVQQHLQQADQMAQMAAQHIDELTQELEQAKQGEAAKIAGEKAKTEREMAAIQSKAELQMQQAEIDAQIAIRKAAIEADTKKQIAQMEIESQEELEEMRGYFQLLAARKEPATDGLRSDVEGEFQSEAQEVPLPRIIKRKLIKMQAPSGAVYTGSIEDDESPEMAAT